MTENTTSASVDDSQAGGDGYRVHQAAALAGPVGVGITMVAWLVAGILFVPSAGFAFGPVGADWTPEAVHAFFFDNVTAFRAGVTLSIFSLSGLGILVAAIGVQLIQAEGRRPVLSFVQIISGTLTWMLLIVPMVILLVAALRPERDLEVLVTLNDLAWILLIPPVAPFVVQNVSIALVIFRDDAAAPVLPRWVAWANLWVAFLFLPGVLSYFFLSGPFAWQGVFSFWLALSAYAVWAFIMGFALRTAIRRDAASEAESV
ncbi:MAG TPA: hypothetical protein VJU58_05475 [Microbacterium sp.]|nr:hypothetical protein [Microbacterium sp.]